MYMKLRFWNITKLNVHPIFYIYPCLFRKKKLAQMLLFLQDKSVISHLSNQNTSLNSKIRELNAQLADLTNASHDSDRELSLLGHTKAKLEQEVSNLQQKLDYLQKQYDESMNEAKQIRENVRSLEQEKTSLISDLNKSQVSIYCSFAGHGYVFILGMIDL